MKSRLVGQRKQRKRRTHARDRPGTAPLLSGTEWSREYEAVRCTVRVVTYHMMIEHFVHLSQLYIQKKTQRKYPRRIAKIGYSTPDEYLAIIGHPVFLPTETVSGSDPVDQSTPPPDPGLFRHSKRVPDYCIPLPESGRAHTGSSANGPHPSPSHSPSHTAAPNGTLVHLYSLDAQDLSFSISLSHTTTHEPLSIVFMIELALGANYRCARNQAAANDRRFFFNKMGITHSRQEQR